MLDLSVTYAIDVHLDTCQPMLCCVLLSIIEIKSHLLNEILVTANEKIVSKFKLP